MKNTRLIEMEKMIAKNGTVSMTELCERFQVSMNTVRRDIAELKRRGEIEKVYGGVSAVKSGQEHLSSYEERTQVGEASKRAICRKAAERIQAGDIIFVDSGTTTVHLPDCLANLSEVTIVTNNLALVQRAIPYENLRVIVLPGQLRRKTNSLTGLDAISNLRQYNVQKAFLATTGTTQDGVTNSSTQELEIKRTAIACSQEKILLLGAEKFGHPGLMTYGKFTDFDYIVTDGTPQQPYLDAIRQAGAELMIAEQS